MSMDDEILVNQRERINCHQYKCPAFEESGIPGHLKEKMVEFDGCAGFYQKMWGNRMPYAEVHGTRIYGRAKQ
jgi:hypothetical protein